MTLFVKLALLLAVLAVVSHASVYVDFVQCVQLRQCGVNNVCSFVLSPPAGSNLTVLSGYLVRISNGLSVPVTLTWDILGTSKCANVSKPVTFTLEEKNSRFINTHCHDLHTVRLQVDNDTADTEITNPEFVCAQDQACEYLVRACFANNDDNLCKNYSAYCQTELKYTSANIDSFRKACIPDCLSEFYSDKISDPFRYDSDQVFTQYLKPYYTPLVAGQSSSSGSNDPSLSVLAIVLIVLAIVLLVAFIGVAIFLVRRRRQVMNL